MSARFFTGQAIIEIDSAQLEQLREDAARAPLHRARLCLHQDHSDPVQEMVIAFRRDSYVRPHRHPAGSESFHVIEGKVLVVFFDDGGAVTRRLALGDGTGAFLYRLSRPLWHTAVPLTEWVILHETATGPFDARATEYAPWAPPAEDSRQVEAFLKRIVADPAPADAGE